MRAVIPLNKARGNEKCTGSKQRKATKKVEEGAKAAERAEAKLALAKLDTSGNIPKI
jgi:hypothetical protein